MYLYQTHLPEIVAQAMSIAAESGFGHSCTVDTGRLLRLLSGHVVQGKIAEIGTGCGVGTAWMASALSSDTQLFTVDLDEARVAAARTLFGEYPNVLLLAGDWRQLASFGPFDLIFADVGDAKVAGADAVLNMLRVGGLAVLDDLTPEELWPSEWRGKPDPVREFWLNDPRLAATEIFTTPSTMIILATRIA